MYTHSRGQEGVRKGSGGGSAFWLPAPPARSSFLPLPSLAPPAPRMRLENIDASEDVAGFFATTANGLEPAGQEREPTLIPGRLTIWGVECTSLPFLAQEDP
eukprot:15671-Prorocentrum_minimum.AAC.2